MWALHPPGCASVTANASRNRRYVAYALSVGGGGSTEALFGWGVIVSLVLWPSGLLCPVVLAPDQFVDRDSPGEVTDAGQERDQDEREA